MRRLLKLVMALAVMLGVYVLADTASASTMKEKVYAEYALPKEASKFPMKLTNGLTVSTAKSNGKTIPVIKKGTKTVWQGKALATNSKIRFTVSKNGDTFLYYNQTHSGSKGHINLVGVSKAGKIILNSNLTHNKRMRMDFLSATLIELGKELDHEYYSSEYYSQFFQLYKDGSMKKVEYFDQKFADSLKKGQLKWTYGAVGSTYKNVFANVKHLDRQTSTWYFGYVSTWKNVYIFNSEAVLIFDANNKNNAIKQTGKTEYIGYRHILIDKAEAKSTLRRYLGEPLAPFSYEYEYVNESRKNREVYNAGKYYFVVEYSTEYTNIVTLSIMLKEMYYLHYYTG